MKLIFVNRFFYPDHSASSQMLADLAFALAKRGYEVCVITSRLSYDGPTQTLPAQEEIDGVEVLRVWTSRFGRRHLLARLIDYVTFYLSASARLFLLTRRGDAVVAMTDPPLFSLCAAPIARLRGALLLNWLQDIFPETAQALDVAQRYGLRFVSGALASLRNLSLKGALNVVLGERMQGRVSSFGIPPERVRIISNFADGELIKPLDGPNPLRAGWGLADAFVVGYSGNLGRAHDYKTMLEAMTLLEAGSVGQPVTAPRIVWLMIGGGNNYENLRREVERRQLSSVRFMPYQPRERLGESLAVADIHIVTLNPLLEGLIVPSKFYAIAAAARPTLFIGDADGEIARLIARHACGLTIAEGDADALARGLRALAADRSACRQMGAHARSAFEAEYDKPLAVDRWQSLLSEMFPCAPQPVWRAQRRAPATPEK